MGAACLYLRLVTAYDAKLRLGGFAQLVMIDGWLGGQHFPNDLCCMRRLAHGNHGNRAGKIIDIGRYPPTAYAMLADRDGLDSKSRRWIRCDGHAADLSQSGWFSVRTSSLDTTPGSLRSRPFQWQRHAR